MQKYDNIKIERDGPIAIVRFNRPDRANALNHAHLAEIEHAALAFADDASTRVVIFTGEGKHFSSGADLDGGGPPIDGLMMARRISRMGQRATLAIYNMDQITIAAWNGAAMGGGAVLATAMDFRIGADNCFMAYPEIDIGVNLMWKGLPLLTHLVGPANAKRLVISGDRAGAAELERIGALDAVVALDELMPTANAWARKYASKSPIAAQMIKQSVNAIVSALDQSIMHMDVDQNLLSSRTEDRAEAVRAYREKTEPNFKGN